MNTCRLITAALLAGSISTAFAADMPKRKAGLWEMNNRMEGMPSMGPMQMCVDPATDNILQERAEKIKPQCSVMEVKPGAGKMTIHTVCKMENTTVTTDGTFTGNFDSGYKGEMTMRYNPPMQGMSQMRINQEAKWLGPCKSGQKPGDVIMPSMGGMGNVNMQEMMNNPQIQEMMKRQK
jgi:hypothetical protein